MRGERWVVLSLRLGDGSGCFCRFADDPELDWPLIAESFPEPCINEMSDQFVERKCLRVPTSRRANHEAQ